MTRERGDVGFEFEEGQPVSGLVLAATPELLDPNFHQTLVYIVEHGPQGALGFVMNRPLGRKLGEVTGGGDLPDNLRETLVYRGGPVKPNGLLFARFARGKTVEELRCEIVADPAELVTAPKRCDWLRAFAGYAGWGDGQLERELDERAWKVCPPHTAMMEEPVAPGLWQAFTGPDQRWRKLQPLLPKNTGLN